MLKEEKQVIFFLIEGKVDPYKLTLKNLTKNLVRYHVSIIFTLMMLRQEGSPMSKDILD